MAGNKTLVPKGYSSYTNLPARQGDQNNGLKMKTPVNPYVVENKAIERAHLPATGYTNSFGSPTKYELLREYVYAPNGLSTPTYAPRNLYDYKTNNGLNYENSNPLVKNNNVSSTTNHLLSSPFPGSEESQRFHSGSGLAGATHVMTNKVIGPPTAPHPLTTSTKSTSEPFGYFKESVNHSLGLVLDPRRRGVLDDLSTRTAPLQPKSQYERLIAKPNDARHNLINTRSSY